MTSVPVFQRMLREWQADLAARPEEVKNSAAGRNATKTQKQCKDYMRPFLKMCRAKVSVGFTCINSIGAYMPCATTLRFVIFVCLFVCLFCGKS